MAPKAILETNRLVLREMCLADAPFFYELNSDPLVVKYTGDEAFNSLEDARKITQYVMDQYTQYGYGRWLVADKKSGEKLGWCGLKFHPDSKDTDLGYRFMQKYWGKGYATEASIACLQYGFSNLNLSRVIGRVAKENTASVKVLIKTGMLFLKEDVCHGEDALIYELKKENFKL